MQSPAYSTSSTPSLTSRSTSSVSRWTSPSLSSQNSSATPCPFFRQNGFCTFGEVCPLFHPPTLPPDLLSLLREEENYHELLLAAEKSAYDVIMLNVLVIRMAELLPPCLPNTPSSASPSTMAYASPTVPLLHDFHGPDSPHAQDSAGLDDPDQVSETEPAKPSHYDAMQKSYAAAAASSKSSRSYGTQTGITWPENSKRYIPLKWCSTCIQPCVDFQAHNPTCPGLGGHN